MSSKLSFVIELIVNGSFVILYSLVNSNQWANFMPNAPWQLILQAMAYTAPIVVSIVMLTNYSFCRDMEDFFRKYIFSLVVVVPLFITFGDIKFAFWLALVHLFSSILALYDLEFSPWGKKKESAAPKTFFDRIKLMPAQWVIVTFFGTIFLGTLLLILPFSAAEGKSINFIDALFTATSATCVTGLSTLSLADNFSLLGQLVVLALIQIGGLGFMTLSSSLTIIMGKSLGLKNQIMMQDLLEISSMEDLLSMIVDIIKFTLAIETWGGILLSLAFGMEGHEFGQAIYYGFYHSISAFCNAGFALFNDSFVGFQNSPIINLTLCVLITLGGLGFIVLKELESVIKGKRKLHNLSVHSKVVLTTSFAVTILVTLYIFFSEFLYALDALPLWQKVQAAFFQSVTTRTAGFNTLPLNALNPHTLYLISLVMFIGASPGSTGGGIKTTTLAILFQSVIATLKGEGRVQFFDRTIPNHIVVRSIALIVISLLTVSVFILLMMKIETEQGFLSIFFEVISAFATVGLSLGITPYLSVMGKLAMVVLMFIGRVGPLTLVLAIGQKQKSDGGKQLPEGRVIIG